MRKILLLGYLAEDGWRTSEHFTRPEVSISPDRRRAFHPTGREHFTRPKVSISPDRRGLALAKSEHFTRPSTSISPALQRPQSW